MRQRIGVARHQALHVVFKPFQKRQVADQAVFDDFGQSRREFACGQRIQRVGIGQHQFWLPEGAHHVLAAWMVDARLAADGRIHLRQQGRWNLDEGYAALIGRGGESSQVANHPAAERNERRAAVATRGEQCIVDGVE